MQQHPGHGEFDRPVAIGKGNRLLLGRKIDRFRRLRPADAQANVSQRHRVLDYLNAVAANAGVGEQQVRNVAPALVGQSDNAPIRQSLNRQGFFGANQLVNGVQHQLLDVQLAQMCIRDRTYAEEKNLVALNYFVESFDPLTAANGKDKLDVVRSHMVDGLKTL